MLNYKQKLVRFLLHKVQMNTLRLDRLSALLEGLAPAVALAATSPGGVNAPAHMESRHTLQVYVLTGGAVRLHAGGAAVNVLGPALMAVNAAQAHQIETLSPDDTGQLMCAQTRLTGPVATLFMEEFADPRVMPLADDEPALRLAMTLIETEMVAPRCGQPALLNRAGDILFIGLLRHMVAHPVPHGTGLFNGLADPRIAKALVAMHQRPDADWSLERLAETAGMSRTAFASTFRKVMRRTPGRYLSAIRLALAQRAVELGKGLKEAARTAGYGNTSALSRALSRARGPCAE